MDLYPHLFWIADPNDGYDCSNKTYEEWAATGVIWPGFGLYYILSGFIITLLYTIVVWAMTDKEILSQPCYKLMYFNCFIDIGNIICNSLAFGVLLYKGAVFCTYPKACFIFGSIALSCWCSSCFNCVVIGINRCCTMFNHWTHLFQGKLMLIWFGISFFIIIFVPFFTRPPIFNSMLGAYFYIPFIRDMQTEIAEFTNSCHFFMNFFTGTSIALVYIVLCLRVVFTQNAYSVGGGGSARKQHLLFIQCVIICLPTAYEAYLYVYMQFFAVPEWVIIFASLTYQACSAIPCFTYLIFNSAIRRRVRKVLHLSRGDVAPSYHSSNNTSHNQQQPHLNNMSQIPSFN